MDAPDVSFLPVMGGAVIAFYGLVHRIERWWLRRRAVKVIRLACEFEVTARRKK